MSENEQPEIDIEERRRGSAKHIKEIVKLINQNAQTRSIDAVFRDFVAMSAIALSNAFDKVHFKEREDEYFRIIEKYTKEELQRFPLMFSELTLAYEYGFDDVLGRLYMQLELGNARTGQFFTPYTVCRLMSNLTGDSKESLQERINKRGYITASDPCVGAGAMMIALAEDMYSTGINYQYYLHVTAVDIDITAVHMSYIQFTMYGIPAIIIHGNSLDLKEYSHWYTMGHFIGNFEERFAANKFIDNFKSLLSKLTTPPAANKPIAEQIKPLTTETKSTEDHNQLVNEPIVINEQIILF